MMRIIVPLLLCCATALAQPKEPVRPPFFMGDSLPMPPQQNAPWPHGDDALSEAAATLFEQGLADPRGLEYEEIEIAVGNPWNGGGYAMKTHGWVWSAKGKSGQFAVAWNGLVYPVVRVGDAADLHRDWASVPQATPTRSWEDRSAEEASSLDLSSPGVLKIALLARLGESDIVKRFSNGTLPKSDPYLEIANNWTWFAFERAVCAHERGDDHLALADARMLSKSVPLIEAEAERRGFKRGDSIEGYVVRDPNRTAPYLPALTQLPALLADSERRVANHSLTSTPKKDIAALVDDLENVDVRQSGQPGGVDIAGDACIQALVKRGDKAVEPLLGALENDDRLTRSVSFGRDFFRSRHLISVSEAAYAALVDLLRVGFKSYDDKGQTLSKKQMAAQIRVYWAKMGALSPAERFYATLKDDHADKDQWLQAAANIVQPADVKSHGGWISIPNRKMGQTIQLRGEKLRDGRTPSVSQLLARRSEDIAAIRTGSSTEGFLYLDAGQMALNLSAWDKKAAIPTLKNRLTRAWSIGAQPNDILAFNGNPAEKYGRMIASMTLARARGGDLTAYDEYAAWIQKVQLKGSFAGEELQKPLVEGTTRPSVQKTIDYLFNDPKSAWSDLLAHNNGIWLPNFWQGALSRTRGFRKQAGRALNNTNSAGTITFHPRKDWKSQMEADIRFSGMSMGFSGSGGDPDTPPVGEARAFRFCDITAYFYSQYQHGPKFQLFWPEKKRDAGVLACRQWLNAQ